MKPKDSGEVGDSEGFWHLCRRSGSRRTEGSLRGSEGSPAAPIRCSSSSTRWLLAAAR